MSDTAITYLTSVIVAVLAVVLSGSIDGFWIRAAAAVLLGLVTAVVTQAFLRSRRPRTPRPGVDR